MSRRTKIIFSIIVLFIGIVILFSEYFNSKKIKVYDYMNELYYSENIETDEINDLTEIVEEDNENNEEKEDTSYTFNTNDNKSIYIGYLSIPEIGLKKGFTEKTSKYNTISKNIQILSSSDYPDKDGGNVIIAAHSGNSSVSYFNKLYLLNNGSIIYIEYNGVNYKYQITNIYTVEKTGQVEVKRNKNTSNVTLITCSKGDSSTQTVYVGDLVSKE